MASVLYILYKPKSFVNNHPRENRYPCRICCFLALSMSTICRSCRYIVSYYYHCFVWKNPLNLPITRTATASARGRVSVFLRDWGMGKCGNVSPEREVLFSSPRPPTVIIYFAIYRVKRIIVYITRALFGITSTNDSPFPACGM